MRTIPVFDNSTGLFQAGDDISRIWNSYRKVGEQIHTPSDAVFHRFGSTCPSTGCGRCDNPACFFCEFIRNYCDCPHGD